MSNYSELFQISEDLYNALQLAKEMFVANDIELKHTFEVMDEAIEDYKQFMEGYGGSEK